MYSIYIDNGTETLLYSPTETDDGYIVLKPQLVYQLDKAASLTFVLPPVNPHYTDIHKLKTILTVYDGEQLIFRGRCYQTRQLFDNLVEYKCESEWAFLSSVDVAPYSGTGRTFSTWITHYLNLYNDGMPENKKIIKGQIESPNEDGDEYYFFESTAISTVQKELLKIVDEYGGFFSLRRYNNKTYLDYSPVPDSPEPEAQVIEFGTNLLDFSKYIDASKIVTKVQAYGADVTIGDTKQTITATAVTKTAAETLYGTRVYRIVKFPDIGSGAETQEDVSAATAELQELAQAYADMSVLMAITIELSAIDLHLLDINQPAFVVGKAYRVISDPHGIDAAFTCNKISLDLTDAKKNKYTFGQARYSLTERMAYTRPVV